MRDHVSRARTRKAVERSEPGGGLFSRSLGGAAADALGFGAVATEVVEGADFLHPAFVEVVADFFAFVANEIETVDALVDFFAVQHAAAEFLDTDTEKLFIVPLYLAPAGFVTRKIFIFRLVMGAVVDIIVTSVFGRPCRALLLCSWHLFRWMLPYRITCDRRFHGLAGGVIS